MTYKQELRDKISRIIGFIRQNPFTTKQELLRKFKLDEREYELIIGYLLNKHVIQLTGKCNNPCDKCAFKRLCGR